MPRDFFSESAASWVKRSFGWINPGKKPSSSTLYETQDEYTKQALASFADLMGNHLLLEFFHEMRPAMEATESPIERTLLLALTLVASREGEVVFRRDGQLHGLTKARPRRRTRVTVEPQAEVGDYRVDFLVEFARTRKDYSRGEGTITTTKKGVLECDGHEFHERTKEQAEADKTRDRTLQDAADAVLRFTGSEIHRKPFECADKAIRLLRDKLWRHRPAAPVSVEAFRTELEKFLHAHGGLGDTTFWTRQELIDRKEDIWPGVELGVASEGPLGRILTWYYYGQEALDAYEDFCELVGDLGWCMEEITHYKVFFYRDDPEPVLE